MVTGTRRSSSRKSTAGYVQSQRTFVVLLVCFFTTSVVHVLDVLLLQEPQLFWNPTPEIKRKRLKRFTVPVDAQGDFESER